MSDTAAYEREKGLKILRGIITSLSQEERHVFCIIQTARGCQRDVWLTKSRKTYLNASNDKDDHSQVPKLKLGQNTAGPEILLILDLIQGISLIHYESKKFILKNQRFNVLAYENRFCSPVCLAEIQRCWLLQLK